MLFIFIIIIVFIIILWIVVTCIKLWIAGNNDVDRRSIALIVNFIVVNDAMY